MSRTDAPSGPAGDWVSSDSTPVGWVRPAGRLVRAIIATLASRRVPDASTFLRGLSIGALVGAAIAGSTVWERRRRHRSVAAPPAREVTHGEPASNDTDRA